ISHDEDLEPGHLLLGRKRDSGRVSHQLDLHDAVAFCREQIVLELTESKSMLVEGAEPTNQPILHCRWSGAGTSRSGCLANDLTQNLVAVAQAERCRWTSGVRRRDNRSFGDAPGIASCVNVGCNYVGVGCARV